MDKNAEKDGKEWTEVNGSLKKKQKAKDESTFFNTASKFMTFAIENNERTCVKHVDDVDKAFITYIKVQMSSLSDEHLKEKTKIKIQSILSEARLASMHEIQEAHFHPTVTKAAAKTRGTTSLPVTTAITSQHVTTVITSLPVTAAITSVPVTTAITSVPVTITITCQPVIAGNSNVHHQSQAFLLWHQHQVSATTMCITRIRLLLVWHQHQVPTASCITAMCIARISLLLVWQEHQGSAANQTLARCSKHTVPINLQLLP